MPQPSILLLISSERDTEAVRRQAQSMLQHWPGQAPTLRHANAWQAMNEPKLLKGVGVAWLWLESDPDGRSFELIDQLQTRPLPVMLTNPALDLQPGEPVLDGVIACPPATEPALACALLAALHSQANTFTALRSEVELLRLHQEGVIDQIQKVDEELRLAAQLQREFLPTDLPRLGSIAFHVLWRPAGYVSGDIYDVQRLDEDHVGMFIADAVGHGVPAALMTVYIKRSLATKEIDPGHPNSYRIVPPGETLYRLNHDLVRQHADKVRFATAAYAVIDTRALTVQIARAGHPFPMLLRHDGTTEMLEPDGGVLGVFAEQTFEQLDLQLQQGDRLLLYSDGFEMAFPEQSTADTTGRKRLANQQYTQEFEKLRDEAMEMSLLHLSSRLDSQAGSLNQRDDLTILAAVAQQ